MHAYWLRILGYNLEATNAWYRFNHQSFNQQAGKGMMDCQPSHLVGRQESEGTVDQSGWLYSASVTRRP